VREASGKLPQGSSAPAFDGRMSHVPKREPPTAEVLASLREVYEGWRHDKETHLLEFEGYQLVSTNGARSESTAPHDAAQRDTHELGTTWLCLIPGKGLWHGARIPLRIVWPRSAETPQARLSFPEWFFHPNVYPSGKLCNGTARDALLDVVLFKECFSTATGAKATLLKRILVAVVNSVLCKYHIDIAAQEPAWRLFSKGPSEALEARVKTEVAKYLPLEGAHVLGDRHLSSQTKDELAEEFGALLNDVSLADVTLRCCGEAIRAHRVVLCCRSPVFRAQLVGSMSRPDQAEIDVSPDIDPATLRRVLAFIYAGTLPALDVKVSELQALLPAADYYGLTLLVATCGRRLAAALDISNVVTALLLAHHHNVAGLKCAALVYLSKHAVAAMNSEEWSRLGALPRPLDGGCSLSDEVMFAVAQGRPPAEDELPRGKKRSRQSDEANNE
jgi:ubiquitin-conjugating enzyme E2 I